MEWYKWGALGAFGIITIRGILKMMEKDPAIWVSNNFKWSEFTVSRDHPEEAARVAREGWTPATREHAKRLAETVLEPIRAAVGKPIQILSGFRPEPLNTMSGGVPGSQHTDASATDVTVVGLEPVDMDIIFEWGKANRGAFGQIIFYFRKTPHVPGNSHRIHVSLPGRRTGNVKYHGAGVRYKDVFKSIS